MVCLKFPPHSTFAWKVSTPFALCKCAVSFHFPGVELNHGLHLAYCTNIHRGETWRETFDSLKHSHARRPRTHLPARSVRHRPALEQPGGDGTQTLKTLLEFPTLARKKFTATFSRSTDFPTVSWHARQGTGLCPRLDFAGTAPTRTCCLICLRKFCPPESRATSAPCPARSRNSWRHLGGNCRKFKDNSGALPRRHYADSRKSLALCRAHFARQRKNQTPIASRP